MLTNVLVFAIKMSGLQIAVVSSVLDISDGRVVLLSLRALVLFSPDPTPKRKCRNYANQL